LSRGVFLGYLAVAIILFLYCFPIASDYFDNRIVDSTSSTSHFVIPAFGQRQLLSLPQLNDEALRVEQL
jgi:hypothetical protein